jgi:L-ascorbate metabolism protein UlaG (beta-lactamase superfamily)
VRANKGRLEWQRCREAESAGLFSRPAFANETEMIEPVKSDAALIGEITSTDVDRGCALWWLGQSGFLVKYRGGCLLFDPYLSESLTKKYALTDKPHMRMTRRVVDPARLDMVDVVTSTHAHTDHFDIESLIPLKRANPALKLVLPESMRSSAIEKLGDGGDWLLGINDGQTIVAAGIAISAVPAAHETIERDDAGRCRFLGYVARFGDPPIAIYHSGDCVPYEGQADLLAAYGIDIALLPINGRRPERRVAGNFWGREAAQLAHAVRAKLVVPCHFEMFQFNTESPDEFVGECRRLDQPYRVLRCGERMIYH